jgi:hypothetical protein
VTTAFAILFGAVALAIALSFGLGNRELAAEVTREWYERWRRERDELLARERAAEAADDQLAEEERAIARASEPAVEDDEAVAGGLPQGERKLDPEGRV